MGYLHILNTTHYEQQSSEKYFEEAVVFRYALPARHRQYVPQGLHLQPAFLQGIRAEIVGPALVGHCG